MKNKKTDVYIVLIIRCMYLKKNLKNMRGGGEKSSANLKLISFKQNIFIINCFSFVSCFVIAGRGWMVIRYLSNIQTNSILIRSLTSVLSTFISSVLGASKPSFVWLVSLSICQNFLQMCKIFHKWIAHMRSILIPVAVLDPLSRAL